MKKLFAIILVVAVLAGLAACGLGKTEENTAAAFKAGVWAVIENGAESGKTYTFTDSKTECLYDNGLTGLGFDYEIDGDSYIFHMGSADDNSRVSAAFTDDKNCVLTWEDPAREETLKYIGESEEPALGDEPPFGGATPLIINSEPVVVTSESSFERAGLTEYYCDATEKYSFTAGGTDAEWKVYVLDSRFEDGARYLAQAEKPVLEGDGFLDIEEGKFIYIVCGENAFTADKASDAYLTIEYADDSLSGSYQDTYSQRAIAEVANRGTTADIIVGWSSSATENTMWEMSCTIDGDRLVYTDCKKSNRIAGEDSDTEEVIYENGKGYFTLKDGKLLWDGAEEEDCASCVFEKNSASE